MNKTVTCPVCGGENINYFYPETDPDPDVFECECGAIWPESNRNPALVAWKWFCERLMKEQRIDVVAIIPEKLFINENGQLHMLAEYIVGKDKKIGESVILDKASIEALGWQDMEPVTRDVAE